ncbi:DedA family protein [Salipiger mangrovisoli]|uniref:VTT domain-containing protein n=1 Tax=Salipiger mangrovisoli TaxID=2865933 RepID=A0ABR9X7C2_9RHOB|nr:VTT domain-containing protein [Salipiger mangrovisoli]MBE9639456.1 hypothetical protein [Salipiger mangrovisoli]
MLDALIAKYGLIIVYLGCALEGDTVAITSGLLAHHGLLPLWPVLAAAWAGGWSSDVAIFLLARRYRDHPRVQHILAHPVSQGMARRFLARPALLAAAFRFLPGMRTVTPVLLATSAGLRPALYLPITCLAALVWAVVMVVVGHGIGRLVHIIWGHIDRTQLLLAIPALLVVGFWLHRRWRMRRAPHD